MHLMYVDESGCLGSLPGGPSKVQPILCVVGLILPQSELAALTRDWVALKRQFFPGLCGQRAMPLDWHRAEVKGADLRKYFRKGVSRRQKRHTAGFIDKSLNLLEGHRCQFSARVWIKVPDQVFKGHSAYTFAVQALCTDLQRKLELVAEEGFVIADSRMPGPNSGVSHSVFTQKFRAAGDPYPRILEAPVFGHSDNHAGLQLADLLASALLVPMCGDFFLGGKIVNSHIDPGYSQVGERYARQMKRLQFRYNPPLPDRGGLVVSDQLGRRGAGAMFAHYSSAPKGVLSLPPPSTEATTSTVVTTISSATSPVPSTTVPPLKH
jgi:hypothetical protein